MNEVLQQLLETGHVSAVDGTEHRVHSEITAHEGNSIQEIIRTNKPSISLEIGCAFGVSSLFICEALREVGGSRHIIIDPHQSGDTWRGLGLLSLERAGYQDLIEFHDQRSFECLPRLLADGVRVDFAFIDGQHTFDYVLVDFFLIDKLLNVDGIVVFDDYDYPSIKKVCRYVVANLPYQCVDCSTGVETKMSVKRRVGQWVARTYPFSRLSKDEFRRPNLMGLPTSARLVALRKMGEDSIGDGPKFNRRWDTHMEF